MPPSYIKTIFLLPYLMIFFTALCFGQSGEKDDQEWILPHEVNPKQSIDYPQLVNFINKLADDSDQIRKVYMGTSDGGNPIHYLVIADSVYRDENHARQSGKSVIWINNGIHPGEPEGIDATLALIRDYHLSGNLSLLTRDWVMIIIPVYNVDGMLNRGAYSRANQNGPDAYGFRANARNLDLNRDFVKCNSKEAAAFNRLYTQWKPDIFLDNHTSNGADYQHTMTLLPGEYNKLGGTKGEFFKDKLQPILYHQMEERGFPMSPYVMSPGGAPERGITAFYDSPRYSSGYASLHGSIAMMTETHMLKPFIDRLVSNYIFMDILIEFAIKNHTEIKALHESHDQYWQSQERYPLLWENNRDEADSVLFRGYALNHRESAITGATIRDYDQSKPWSKLIPYYNRYIPKKEITIPPYYVIPAGYVEVVQHLRWNGIYFLELTSDTLVEVEEYFLESWTPATSLFEGQPYHRNVTFELRKSTHTLQKGDFIVPTAQSGIRYILETLEPEADDSFFRWNFFDPILQRKEYFSDYVFEPTAQKMLDEQPELNAAFLGKINSNADFAQSPHQRLEYLYLHSPHAEPGYRVYPIKRLWTGLEDILIKF